MTLTRSDVHEALLALGKLAAAAERIADALEAANAADPLQAINLALAAGEPADPEPMTMEWRQAELPAARPLRDRMLDLEYEPTEADLQEASRDLCEERQMAILARRYPEIPKDELWRVR